jgi:hypothetical protein
MYLMRIPAGFDMSSKEGVGLGFEEHIQQTERFALLAADPDVNLVGFSDGSLSEGGNNGGYSWMIALVKDGNILQGDVLAGGGGAALAADNTNVLLSSTRMEALWALLLACRSMPGTGWAR